MDEIQLMMQVLNNLMLVKPTIQSMEAEIKCLNVWDPRKGEFIETILVTLN